MNLPYHPLFPYVPVADPSENRSHDRKMMASFWGFDNFTVRGPKTLNFARSNFFNRRQYTVPMSSAATMDRRSSGASDAYAAT